MEEGSGRLWGSRENKARVCVTAGAGVGRGGLAAEAWSRLVKTVCTRPRLTQPTRARGKPTRHRPVEMTVK